MAFDGLDLGGRGGGAGPRARVEANCGRGLRVGLLGGEGLELPREYRLGRGGRGVTAMMVGNV